MPGPLDELIRLHDERVREREAQEQKAHQQRLAEVRSILKRLNGCCRQAQFRWPDKRDLDRLDFLVSQLVRRVRKRPPLFGWKSYRAIDHHWHLRLWLTIEGLIGRAACNAPRRPLEDYNERLVSPALGELTKKFFQRYREVLNGWDPSTIKWEMYDKLFSSVTGKFISRRVPLTEAKEAASLVFLNLFCKDQQWTKKHWKGAFHLTQWIMTSLQHPETAAKLRRFLIPTDVCTPMLENIRRLPDYFAEKKKMAKRVKDSDRKRRTK